MLVREEILEAVSRDEISFYNTGGPPELDQFGFPIALGKEVYCYAVKSPEFLGTRINSFLLDDEIALAPYIDANTPPPSVMRPVTTDGFLLQPGVLYWVTPAVRVQSWKYHLSVLSSHRASFLGIQVGGVPERLVLSTIHPVKVYKKMPLALVTFE